jgi:hypothetical protein
MLGICKELCTINSQNYLRHLHQEKHQGVNAPSHCVGKCLFCDDNLDVQAGKIHNLQYIKVMAFLAECLR